MELSFQASKAILEIYQQDFDVDIKADNTPLTLADKASHEIIFEGLKDFSWPILSEEGRDISYEERKAWGKFWLVDPLDGTKEFVKKNGEFTTNIALVENGQAVAGVIYAPVLKKLYWAEKGKGAFMAENVENMEQLSDIFSLSAAINNSTLRVVASRSHMTDATKEKINAYTNGKNYELVSIGSSLKFCLLAEGMADFYPRLAPTMEWDTAAGQIIAEEAGFEVVSEVTKKPLSYNKESLVNEWFIAQPKS